MGQNNFFKWITVPPVVAIATVFFAQMMGGGNIVADVDLALWALIWLLFIVLSFLYGMFISHGFNSGLIPLQAVAQGILLCPLALVYGARMVQWLGVVVAVCGGAALVVAYNQGQIESAQAKIPKGVENDVKRIPSKFAITDETGVILNITNDMLEAIDELRDETIGKNISEFFSPVSKTAQIKDKFWDISRKMLDNGRRYYFELHEKGLPIDNGNQNENDSSELLNNAITFFDPNTKLHTYQYGMARINDDLYRLERYGRALSAILIRVVFPKLLPDEDMGKYAEPFNAYCALIKKDIRASDTAIQLDDTQVAVILPECEKPLEENVAERLMSLVNNLCETYNVFYNVTMLNVSVSYTPGGSYEIPTAKILLEKLKNDMTRKYSATALSEF